MYLQSLRKLFAAPHSKGCKLITEKSESVMWRKSQPTVVFTWTLRAFCEQMRIYSAETFPSSHRNC
ncbi:hypothetical protein BIW11_08298 [Tropilaelaps mercedesae]|uniref:Uncharacterized protein n=1 Tax=Tropilaelaps mercedesae TaxID=418985 RepID=A0A1V9XQI7_9ACAR|nr:hypothetical protein BIW11_08298 [Tropilaelaps mercedesae]